MTSIIRLRLGLLVLCLVLSPAANAQTRFQWPSTTVDVSTYTTVEDCLGATQRVADSVAKRERIVVWADTMPFDPGRAMRALPAAVVQTASRCSARFEEPATPLEDFDHFLKLYLQANRDADAAALVARRVSAPVTDAELTGPRSTRGVDACVKQTLGGSRDRIQTACSRVFTRSVLDRALKEYMDARPLRVAEAAHVLEQLIRLTPDPLQQLELYLRMAEGAREAGDSVRVRQIAQNVIARADSLPPALRQRLDTGLNVVGVAHTQLARAALLDSLRRGTPKYVAAMRSLVARVWGSQRAWPLFKPIGERAAPLTGDFWFNRETAGAPRPTLGKVSLVVFVGEWCLRPLSSLEQKWRDEDTCWKEAATLRRIAKRFPSLEITLVSQTRGYFVSAAVDAPAAEAEWVRRWLLDAHRLPGALSVSVTPFSRLPDPDRRRIDKPMPNGMNYSRDRDNKFRHTTMFLVDRTGTIVYYGGLDQEEERPGIFGLRSADLIEILLNRDRAPATGP